MGYAFFCDPKYGNENVNFPKRESPKIKSKKLACFWRADRPHKTPADYHAFHHKLTTHLPPKNTQKSQNPVVVEFLKTWTVNPQKRRYPGPVKE